MLRAVTTQASSRPYSLILGWVSATRCGDKTVLFERCVKRILLTDAMPSAALNGTYKIIPPDGGIIFRELYQALLPDSAKDGFIAITFIYIVFSIQVANNLFSIRASKDTCHTSFYFTTMNL